MVSDPFLQLHVTPGTPQYDSNTEILHFIFFVYNLLSHNYDEQANKFHLIL